MKFNVHGGHNFKVQGASGYFSETKEDRNVKNLVVSKLKTLGHEVYDCTDEDGATQSKNLANIVNKCNAHAVDLDISIHFNASNGAGHGVEVLVYSDKSKAKPYAQNIVNAIANLGFTNRGIKVRTELYVLRKTKAPSLLVECCFCDNKGDANIYNAEKMADAIVKGITGQVVSVQPTQPKPSQTQPSTPKSTPKATGTYEVTASSLKVRKGPGTNYAAKKKSELTADGQKHSNANGSLLKGTRVTVYEWKNDWARTPSGWLSGKYLKKV